MNTIILTLLKNVLFFYPRSPTHVTAVVGFQYHFYEIKAFVGNWWQELVGQDDWNPGTETTVNKTKMLTVFTQILIVASKIANPFS